MAFGGLADCVNIGEVLRAPGGQLCGDEVGTGNEKRLEAGIRVDHIFNPAFPCDLKINTRKVGENIEASRIASKTKEAAAVCKFLRTDAFKRGAELDKGRLGCLRVYQVCFYEKIDVLGKTRLRVKGDGVTANNQVSNAMGMEGGQKVFVVLVHPAPSPSL